MSKGYLYIMSCVVPGLIKIGQTATFEQRMSELERNGYNNVTGLKREFAIEVDDYLVKEKLLHSIFSSSRVGNTELFSLNLEEAIQLLSSFKGKVIYPKEETEGETFKAATDAVDSSGLPNKRFTYSFKSQIDGKKYSASLRVDNGVLYLEAGSQLAPIKVDGSTSWIVKRRSFGTEAYTLKEDLQCTSVSIAACIVSGHAMNGWNAWKDPDGNSINIYRQLPSEE